MLRCYLICLLSLSLVCSALGQGQADNWYFGRNAGVTFNGGSPVALTNGAVNTGEGCSSISDRNGNLLFYTDGIRVWNRNHQQMPNGFGMTGNPSSAQSALIVPQPGSNNLFIVFTVEAEGNAAGFGYSVVDMNLDGGLGDVIAASKNTQLFTPSTEKVTAVKHANGLYVWVIAKAMYSNRHYAYLVDCNGVGTPVISNVGVTEGYPGWGCMSVSPDGTKLASAMCYMGFEMYDFNNATGVISNPILLSSNTSAYGIAFSPDNNLVYGLIISGGQMYQWNTQAGSAAAIISSAVNLGIAAGGANPYRGGAIQQGPDGKLYIPQYNQPYLTAINNPNTLGVGCNIQANAVSLSGRNAALGLPPFIINYLDTSATVTFSGICAGGTTQFTITSNSSYLDSVRWDFGDILSGTQNTSTLLSPAHDFTSPGNYNVRLFRYLDCVIDTTTEIITILPYPSRTQNIAICSGDSYTLPSGNSVLSAGTYNDTISDSNGCDSIIITNLSLNPTYQIVQNPVICDDTTYTRPSGIIVNSTGTYIDTLNTVNGCDSIITTNLIVNPTYRITQNPVICDNETYTRPSGIVVNTAGTYVDTLTTVNGCDSIITSNLTVNPTFALTLNPVICANESYTRPSGIVVNTAGTYTDVLTTVNGCDSVITTQLSVNPIYQVSVSDTICSYQNYTRPSGIVVNSSGTYIDTLNTVNGCDSVITTSLTVINLTLSHTSVDVLCNGENTGSISVSQSGGLLPVSYSWNNVSLSGNSPSNIPAGNYSVTATDAFGCTANDAVVINEPTLLVFSAAFTEPLCHGEANGTISIVPQGGVPPYQFSLNNQLSDSGSFANLSAGSYNLVVTDSHNCSEQSNLVVTEPDLLEIYYQPTVLTMYLGQQIDLDLSTNYNSNISFSWEPPTGLSCSDCSSPVMKPNVTTNYVLTVTANPHGKDCVYEFPFTVTVFPERTFYIPNAFSPNGDNSNDEFRIFFKEKSAVKQLFIKIFNRWGEKVFEANEADFAWDGKFKGLYVAPGNYVYELSAVFLDNYSQKMNGSITVLR